MANFYFHTSLQYSATERLLLFKAPKRRVKMKNCYFPPLFRIGTKNFKTVFVELSTYAISVFSIEIHKNNINTSRVATFYQTKLTFSELLPSNTDFFPGKLYQTIFLSLSDVTLSKSLLAGVSANSTFSAVEYLWNLEQIAIKTFLASFKPNFIVDNIVKVQENRSWVIICVIGHYMRQWSTDLKKPFHWNVHCIEMFRSEDEISRRSFLSVNLENFVTYRKYNKWIQDPANI